MLCIAVVSKQAQTTNWKKVEEDDGCSVATATTESSDASHKSAQSHQHGSTDRLETHVSSIAKHPNNTRKRSIFGSYWEQHKCEPAVLKREPSAAEIFEQFPPPGQQQQLAKEKAIALPHVTSTVGSSRRRAIFGELSAPPHDHDGECAVLAELAAERRPEILQRKAHSADVLDRRPTKSLLKKTPRYSTSLIGKLEQPSTSSNSNSCAKTTSRTKLMRRPVVERSVSFDDRVRVLRYQPSMERYASAGWSKYFDGC